MFASGCKRRRQNASEQIISGTTACWNRLTKCVRRMRVDREVGGGVSKDPLSDMRELDTADGGQQSRADGHPAWHGRNRKMNWMRKRTRSILSVVGLTRLFRICYLRLRFHSLYLSAREVNTKF